MTSIHRQASRSTVAADCELFKRALDALRAHSGRLTSLRLFADHDDIVNSLFDAMSSMGMIPSLRLSAVNSLDHSRRYYQGAEPHPPPHRIPFPPTTLPPLSLSALTLRGCSISWEALSAVIAPTMVDLTIDSIVNPVQGENLLTILESASRSLQTLRLGGSLLIHTAGEELQPPLQRLHLHTLHTLALSELSLEVCLYLLDSFAIPSLTALYLDLYWCEASTLGASHFAPLLHKLCHPGAHISIRTLRELSIRNLGIPILGSPAMLAELWHSLAEIRDMYLDFVHLQIEYWVSFVASAARGSMPKLTSLTICGLSALDVQDYVLARSSAGLDPVAILMFVHPQAPEAQAPDKWLTWLRSHTIMHDLVFFIDKHTPLRAAGPLSDSAYLVCAMSAASYSALH
ncbi:hypothetical protein L227DRAFT_568864, partial [Lentinus tigrinus ALCF2SS1-6]